MSSLRTVIASLVLLVPLRASADEISDEEDVCRGSKPGVACTVQGRAGTCQESTCSRIDYSSDPPKPVERACRICVATAEPTANAEPTPTKTDPPAKTDTPAQASAPAKSGCSVSSEASALSLGSLALGLVLLALARRR